MLPSARNPDIIILNISRILLCLSNTVSLRHIPLHIVLRSVVLNSALKVCPALLIRLIQTKFVDLAELQEILGKFS